MDHPPAEPVGVPLLFTFPIKTRPRPNIKYVRVGHQPLHINLTEPLNTVHIIGKITDYRPGIGLHLPHIGDLYPGGIAAIVRHLLRDDLRPTTRSRTILRVDPEQQNLRSLLDGRRSARPPLESIPNSRRPVIEISDTDIIEVLHKRPGCLRTRLAVKLLNIQLTRHTNCIRY